MPLMPSSAPLPATSTPPALGWLTSGLRITDPRPAVHACIDLEQPQLGIRIAGPTAVAGDTLLGLDLRSGGQLTDHWLRGGDVTAVYESDDARRLRTTVMWRLHPAGETIRAWELVVSAQTALAQSDSVLAVVSEADATNCLWGTCRDGAVVWQPDATAAATCVLFQRGGPAHPAASSVLVATHPGEARRIAVERHGQRAVVECWIFSSAIEKGVLLRSRVLAAIGPTTGDLEWASGLATAFSASEPMLTA